MPTTLTLTKMFVNLVATGQSVSGQSLRDRQEKRTTGTDVRQYANGRQRSITVAGKRIVYGPVTMVLLTTAQKDLLDSWTGALVQVRDNEGRLFVGTYPAVDIAERVADSLWNVTFTLTVVTAPVGV